MDRTISVIVPVYNDRQGLKQCLSALSGQSYPRKEREYIVVDNDSEEEIRSLVEDHDEARYIFEGARGSYAARNRGIEAASGSIYAFTDADCRPAEGWLMEGAQRLRAGPDVGLVGGRIEVETEDRGNPTPVELYDIATAFDQASYISGGNFSVTANLFTRAEVVHKVGPFDATLASGGDSEWSRRVHDYGYDIAYEPEAVVYHPARRNLHDLRAKLRRLATGSYQKHADEDGEDMSFWGRIPGWLMSAISELRTIQVTDDLDGVWERLQASGVSLYAKSVVARETLRHRGLWIDGTNRGPGETQS